ncbi:EamA family transporter [uncultured Mycolicibacterium sp.]|uniref:EamA family transporter n=1 Tax=uncultured Mycolicibacterium sp. TaxID=2320817 RepID=UPI0026319437|nr:EamA family transporter [uncultured Mycolicibacterium sp.]
MVLVSYPVTAVVLCLLAAGVGGHVTAPAVWWGLASGVAQAFGVWWFYAALGSGPIAVVSPLTAVVVAAIPVGAGLAMGERPSVIAGVGIALAMVAVVLVSREATDEPPGHTPPRHRFTVRVAWLTLGAGLGFGLNFVLLDQVPVEAKLWPLVIARVAATAVVVTAAAVSANLRPPTGPPLRLALLAAGLDVVSNVATLLALQASMLSLAGVLMSLYPAGTVLLAIVVLRERVSRGQAFGMVLALAAVAMIATAR